MKLVYAALIFLSPYTYAQEKPTEPQQKTETQPTSQEVKAPEMPEKEDEPEPVDRRTPVQKAIKLTVGIVATGEAKTKFDDMKIKSTTSTVSAEAEFTSESTAGLLLEIRGMPLFNWGFQAGLVIENKRKIKDVKISAAGTTISGTYVDPKPTTQMILLYGNVVYRWEQFYLPFGLNLSAPTFESKTAAPDATIDISGGVGAQIAAGFQFTEHFGLEIQSHVTGIKIIETTSTYTAEYGTGHMSDVRILAKFAF